MEWESFLIMEWESFLIRLPLQLRRVLHLQVDQNILLVKLRESKLFSMVFMKGNLHKFVWLIV